MDKQIPVIEERNPKPIITRRTFIRASLAATAAPLTFGCRKARGAALSGAELKKGLIEAMKARGAYDVRIADPRGFKHPLAAPHSFKVAAPLA
ncbi:MAG: twin-arginine translocation signal domain-containing protein, partial [Verrucomicrobiae bacterium]|nr:twin-arginine translocation signal domain-containing protein [Verrucomicrobiae bacterium]